MFKFVLIGLTLISPQSSLGAIRALVTETPINPVAVTGLGGDPALANFRTFDLQVEITQGSTLNVSSLYVQLTQGSFYSPQSGRNFPIDRDEIAQFPHLEYDSYVSVPGYVPDVTTILTPGRRYGIGPSEFPAFGRQQVRFNVDWGEPSAPPNLGIFTIARLTVSNDAVGTLDGVVFTREQFNVPNLFFGDIASGVVGSLRVPEPTIAALALPGLLLRRRAKGRRGKTFRSVPNISLQNPSTIF